MKMLILLYALLSATLSSAIAQSIVIDPWHFAAVAENAAVRSTAESTHGQYLNKINSNINDLNINVGSLVLAQTLIYEGLYNVNSALKNGLAVKNMAVTVADITYYINQAAGLAQNEPYLLTFASGMASEMRQRAVALVNDVAAFIFKEGDNVLADYNARDQLFRKVTMELQVIDGLAYGAWKAMYWAKQRGIIASINPFANFINQDKTIVKQVILNAKYLNP